MKIFIALCFTALICRYSAASELAVETVYYNEDPTRVDLIFQELSDVVKYMGYVVENDISLESVYPFFNITDLQPSSLYTAVLTPFKTSGEFGEPAFHMFQTLEEYVPMTEQEPTIPSTATTKPITTTEENEPADANAVVVTDKSITESTTTTNSTTSTTESTTSTTDSTTEAIKMFPNKAHSTESTTTTVTYPNEPQTTEGTTTVSSTTTQAIVLSNNTVDGLAVDDFDKHSLTVSWYPVEGAIEYLVAHVPLSLTDDSIDSFLSSETSAAINNLLPAHYYTIKVSAVFENTMSLPSTVNARTDGNGFEMLKVWSYTGEYPQGGSGKITLSDDLKERPTTELLVYFPCAVENFHVWNGMVDTEKSNTTSGIYFITQDQKWMVVKGYIGFNMNYGECRFMDEEVTVIDASENEIQSDESEFENIEVELPVTLYSSSNSAGIINLDFSTLVKDFGYTIDNVKKFAFMLDGGKDCPEYQLKSCWGLSEVDTSALYDTQQERYFLQNSEQWWMHRSVGLQIVYDPFVCIAPSGITATALIGGDMSNALHYVYETESDSYDGPCK